MKEGLKMKFPDNKKFAFSIFDDTDKATIMNTKPIYDLLKRLKIYTTKSVFVFSNKNPIHEANRGDSLENPNYLSFVLGLKDRGFEIAFHGAKGGNSKREEIIEAIEKFKELTGHYPKTYANHLSNKENLYWGAERLNSYFLKILYKLATFRRERNFLGHTSASEYFWGDIIQKYITYTRNFVFKDIDTLKINPSMPYHDPQKSYINFWFSSCDGHDVNAFNKLINPENIDKLEQENGVCIVYTHFAKGFAKNGKVDETTVKLLTNLSQKNGWFAPVSDILDFLKKEKKSYNIPYWERIKMEYRWFISKIIHGTN